ncbi:MAG: FKBP-type peptidyl-prolyl cis-trans isomerase [Brumimicrobium sp.]|nr:FKBP-type peptidyl-prolyl cis-trans isomerase [Brumimicrobium sp.]MCO5269084.1 FKBP-type peptidyl-prolyl cis-trans isomerase [Brumimicrobium sp.]
MKRIIIVSVVMLLVACGNKPKDASGVDLDKFEQRISYALGADMGANLQNIPDEIYDQLNKKELENGFYNLLTSQDEKSKECYEILNQAFSNPTGIDTTQHGMKEISHCYGAIFGEMLRKSLNSKNAFDKVDADIIRIGFVDAMNKVDTLIEMSERQKMIIDFNNDLNKIAGNLFMEQKKEEFKSGVHPEGYILIQNAAGNGEGVDLSKEYQIVYTLINTSGDTIISTVKGMNHTDDENSQTVSADDIVFPQGWKQASEFMKVGGDYTLYLPYDLAYGDDGLRAPNSQGYIVQPFSALIIHSKILVQNEKNFAIKEKGRKILEEAKKQPKSYVDKSGFVLITLEEGKGASVPEGGDVQAHYILTDSNGEVVENSYMGSAQYNQPAPTFSLAQVVKGWQLGIPKMKIGGRYKLVLPYDLAYGETGNQGVRPYETLTFEIEILNAGKPGSLVGNK